MGTRRMSTVCSEAIGKYTNKAKEHQFPLSFQNCCALYILCSSPLLKVNPDITANFDSTSLPLSSPFLGVSGEYHIYIIGASTGNYTVSYTPLVRGDYAITVKKPPVWEVQLVQTVFDATGEDLSGG